MSQTADQQVWDRLILEAGQVFTPNTPIDEKSLFAGRQAQIRRVIDVVNQKGQHAIIFGERGVGKTSLANVLSSFLNMPAALLAPRINCDSTDTFDSVWRKVLSQVEVLRGAPPAGFGARPPQPISTTDVLGDVATPDAVRRTLAVLGHHSAPIVIVDEFDRLARAPRLAFADTIKTLSDHAVPATIVVVGVADSVEQLIAEHQSVERALVQIQMPRMLESEIHQIISTGVDRLGMTIERRALDRIGRLAQGLPHYAQLMGLHTTRVALDRQSTTVVDADVTQAIRNALEDAQHSVRRAYHDAIRSPRKDNLFADVLLACALAPTTQLGFFAAQDVRGPMRAITGKNYEIPSFAQHLNEFSDSKRGPLLQKAGESRRYVYRFINPLMQPFVIMQGVVAGRVPTTLLAGERGSL
jgi:Cdc6-like AAA superfamily ATPase